MTCHCQPLTCIPLERSAGFEVGGREQEKLKEATGSGQGRVGRAEEHVWPTRSGCYWGRGTAEDSPLQPGGTMGGCPGPPPQAPALEQPDSNHAGPDPGEGSAFLCLAGKQHGPRRSPLGRKSYFSVPATSCATERQPGGWGLPRRDGDGPQGQSPGCEAATEGPASGPKAHLLPLPADFIFLQCCCVINTLRDTAHHSYDYYLKTCLTALISSAHYFLKNYPRGPKFSKSGLVSLRLWIRTEQIIACVTVAREVLPY